MLISIEGNHRMKLKRFLKIGGTLCFITLLTIQICVGFLYALKLERGQIENEKIVIPIRTPRIVNSSTLYFSLLNIEAPYKVGKSKSLDKNIYGKSIKVLFEPYKEGNKTSKIADYGDSIDLSNPLAFNVHSYYIQKTKWKNTTHKEEPLETPLVSFYLPNAQKLHFYTDNFDSKKLKNFLETATGDFTAELRIHKGLLQISNVFYNGKPINDIIRLNALAL